MIQSDVTEADFFADDSSGGDLLHTFHMEGRGDCLTITPQFH